MLCAEEPDHFQVPKFTRVTSLISSTTLRPLVTIWAINSGTRSREAANQPDTRALRARNCFALEHYTRPAEQ
jgi:hypothetical protein